jgi:formylglycine-generating enzyme required for sulfatase activity
MRRFMRIATPILATLFLLSMFIFVSCSDDDNSTNTTEPLTAPQGMILITAKDHTFQMGSSNGEDDELPVHTVSFTHDFWMDTTEVTQGDYDTLMSHSYSAYSSPAWFNPHGVGTRYPAYYVQWGDAALYCNARSKRDGLDTVYRYTGISGIPGNWCELQGVTIDYAKNGYRLPTEAEWEYACRAGTTSDYCWGKDYDPYPENGADTTEVCAHAIWYANAWQFGADSSAFGTHAVASTTPNANHLYDMAGNLYEWCNDWYDSYSVGTAADPAGPDSGAFRVLRGGSWGSRATYLRSANRTFSVPDYSYYFVGFRAVRPVR